VEEEKKEEEYLGHKLRGSKRGIEIVNAGSKYSKGEATQITNVYRINGSF
jgi:hypothetical protein